MERLSKHLSKDDVVVADDGAHLTWAIQSLKVLKNQRLFSAFGNSPMGYAFPAAIGASIALKKKKVICIDGDGSIQINIQELQTLVSNNLPVKIILLNNEGYGIIKQFQELYLDRRYEAIVWGQPKDIGVIEKNIGRSPYNRKKMAISIRGKIAKTKWKVIDIYAPLGSLIECKLETGRTHQIRVHLSDIGHSVIGDDLYGKPLSEKRLKNYSYKAKIQVIKSFKRQALHATKLSFSHPITNKYLEFTSPLPKEMIDLIEILKNK